MSDHPPDQRTYRVSVVAPAGVVMSCPLSSRPLYVGRAPTNDLVLHDQRVSARHCAISTTGGRVFVEDLGSRNGTWLGERRIPKIERWMPEERLRFGPAALELTLEASGPSGADLPFVLRDEDTGLCLPLRDGCLRLGGAGADHSVPGAAEHVLQLDPDGQWWVGREDGSLEPLAEGEVLEVGCRRFRLVRAPDGVVAATRDAAFSPWPYLLRVAMRSALGPVAEVVHQDQRAVWTSENRVVVWWLLGRRLAEDRAAGVSVEAAGWVTEQEVASGVWGRDAVINNLGVLVTRIRHDLRRAHLDPWFLERRRGHLRARVERVEVSA